MPVLEAPAGPASASRGRAASTVGPALLTLLLLSTAFIGRGVISSDAAEAISDTFGLLVTGRLEAATMPPAAPDGRSAFAFKSHYGVFPSCLLLPFTVLPWVLRGRLGAVGLDAGIALAWLAGALLAALAFRKLARQLAPGASPWWAPAFLGSTFLWPYAADSFFEPFAAAGLALAAASLLDGRKGRGAWTAALAATAFAGAALLKPVVWITAPVFVLAAALAWRGRPGAIGRLALFGGLLAAGLVVAWGASALRFGGGANLGYGDEALRFTNPLLAGLWGLLLSPNRGLFLYAPLALVGLVAIPRAATPAARLLCVGAPLVLLLTVARFEGWHGGSAWGPRHLLPVLPLVAAPAVLAGRRLAAAAVAAGFAVNLLGVLVAAGAYISWAERLVPPGGTVWPPAGPEIVSVVPGLSPVKGHAWLLARSLGLSSASPAARLGAAERQAPPRAAGYLSPWLVRAVAGLPPVPPTSPAILHRIGLAYALRGDPATGLPFLKEAVALQPGRPGLKELLRALEAAPRSGPRGPG